MNQALSTIMLLRHGEPKGSPSSEHVFRGITDHKLTQNGWQEMHSALQHIDDFEQILTSPLKRCFEFAEALSKKRGVPLAVINELKEINFGQWDGQSVQSIEKNDGERLRKFWQNPSANTPPGGEPVVNFQKRVVSSWHELLLAQRGKNCLLITHGGVQKIILAEVLKMPIEAIHNIEVPYACCTTFNVYYNKDEIITTLKSHMALKSN